MVTIKQTLSFLVVPVTMILVVVMEVMKLLAQVVTIHLLQLKKVQVLQKKTTEQPMLIVNHGLF